MDFGQLRVTNSLSRNGNYREDPSAVHVDVIHAEVFLELKKNLGIP